MKKDNGKNKNVNNEKRDKEVEPDWTKKCGNCDQSPIVPVTGLCGPCTFGEADTAFGNW